MTEKYSMMQKDTFDNSVESTVENSADLDPPKGIGQEDEKEEEKGQHQEEKYSEEWIPGGSLGPFSVAEPVLPGTSTVIQCFTHRENQRGLMRFDPPWGLVFTQHNQTQSGFVNYHILKGKVDPSNLPEVSCRTVASRGFNFESTTGAASDASHQRKQQRQQGNSHGRTGRMYAPELISTKGSMNSSQLSFVLLLFSAGAYYLYSVHIVPKLAASRNSSTEAAADDLLKNYTDTRNRPKKKNKGSWEKSKKKKSGGNNKKQGRTIVAQQQRSKDSGSQRSSVPSKSNSNSKRNDERLSLDKTTLEKTANVQSDADTDIDTTDDGDAIVGLNVARSDDSTSDISSLLSVHDVEGTAVPLRPKPEHNPKTVKESPIVSSKDDEETTIEDSALPTAETNDNEVENKKMVTKELVTDSETIDSTQNMSIATREEKQQHKPEGTPTRNEISGTTQDEKIEQSPPDSETIDSTEKKSAFTREEETEEKQPKEPEEMPRISESSSTFRINQKQHLSTEESTPDIPVEAKEKPTMDESIHSKDTVVDAAAVDATASKLNHKISPPPGLSPIPAKADPVTNTADDSASSVCSSSPSLSSKQKNIIVLLIEGMTCGGCVKVVNRVLNSFDEIDSVDTDLKTCKSTLVCNVPRLNLLPILTALDDVGMQAYLQSQSLAHPLPDQSSPENDTNKSSAPLPGTAPAKCPLLEQAEKQQTLGAIGARPKEAPFASSIQKPASPLSLMDELRVGSTPLRRYQCSCGCEGCICSARQVHKNDNGTDISLTDLCNRLESTLGTTKLEETFRKTGGSLELRNRLEEVAFPCGCSDKKE